ncbi:MAG: hypothetical protein RLZZ461_68 [Planctomycetota bacterium]|jgi:hypothetical protein
MQVLNYPVKMPLPTKRRRRANLIPILAIALCGTLGSSAPADPGRQDEDQDRAVVEQLLGYWMFVDAAIENNPSPETIELAYETLFDNIQFKLITNETILDLNKRLLEALTEARVDTLRREQIHARFARISTEAFRESVKEVVDDALQLRISTLVAPAVCISAMTGGSDRIFSFHDKVAEAESARTEALADQRAEALTRWNDVRTDLLETFMELHSEIGIRQDHIPRHSEVRELHDHLRHPDPATRRDLLEGLADRGAFPTYGPLWFQLGLARQQAGDLPGAIEALTCYIGDAGENPKPLGGHFFRDPMLIPAHVTRALSARELLDKALLNDRTKGDDGASSWQQPFDRSMQALGALAGNLTETSPGIGVAGAMLLAIYGEESDQQKSDATLKYFARIPDARDLVLDARITIEGVRASRSDDAARLEEGLREIERWRSEGGEALQKRAMHDLRLMHLFSDDERCLERLLEIVADLRLVPEKSNADEAIGFIGLGGDGTLSLCPPESWPARIDAASVTIGDRTFEAELGSSPTISFPDCELDWESWRRKGIHRLPLTLEDDLGTFHVDFDLIPAFDRPAELRCRSVNSNGTIVARQTKKSSDHLYAEGREGPLMELGVRRSGQPIGAFLRGKVIEDLTVTMPESAGAFKVSASTAPTTSASSEGPTSGNRVAVLTKAFDPDVWRGSAHALLIETESGFKITVTAEALLASEGKVTYSDVRADSVTLAYDGRTYRIDAGDGGTGRWKEQSQ